MPKDETKLEATKSDKFKEVPPFETYFPSVSDMNLQAKKFYRHWKSRWKEGEAIKIDGNISYIYTYAYKVLSKIDKDKHEEVISELKKLSKVYQYEKLHYLDRWTIDAYVETKQFKKAWEYHKQTNILHGEKFWTIKRKSDTPLKGAEVLSARKLTDFGKAKFDEVAKELSKIFREYEEKNNIDLVHKVTSKTEDKRHYDWPAYKATELSCYLPIKTYKRDFSNVPELFESNLARKAENRLRKRAGVPEVGRGWVSETVLKNIIEKLLGPEGYKVKQHASLDWLKGQHLDVFVPGLDLGIEYMGKQHYHPVDRFGGKKNFEKTKKRDKKKKQKCDKNDVSLLYFRFDEPLNPEFVAKKLSPYLDVDLENKAKRIEFESKDKLVSYSGTSKKFKKAKEKSNNKNSDKKHVHRSQDKKLQRLKEKKRSDIEIINKAVQGKWQAVFDILEERKKEIKKRKGLKNPRTPDIKRNAIKERYESFGQYFEADQLIKEKMKASYSLREYLSRGFTDKFALLFEEFNFTLLSNLLENSTWLDLKKISQFLLDRDEVPENLREKIGSLVLNGYFFNETELLKNAQGLSWDAKLILWRLSYKKNNSHEVSDLENYSRVIANPTEAVIELYNQDLIIMEDEMDPEDLLEHFTIQEIKSEFYHDDISWAGNKGDKIRSIKDSYPNDVIRNRSKKLTDDFIIRRAWDFNQDIKALVNAQLDLIEYLIALEGKKIRDGDFNEEKWLKRFIV